jgi:hypothetical protein
MVPAPPSASGWNEWRMKLPMPAHKQFHAIHNFLTAIDVPMCKYNKINMLLVMRTVRITGMPSI